MSDIQTRSAVDLMRESDPLEHAGANFDPDAPVARAALERILVTSQAAPRSRPHRRLIRRSAVVASVAAVAAAGVALLPTSGGSPDVIASAAAALTEPDTILHFKTKHVRAGNDRRNLRLSEEWHATDGRQKREVSDGPGRGRIEQVYDIDTKTDLTYIAETDTLLRHADPDLFNGPQGLDAPVPYPALDMIDLAVLLERARTGDDEMKLVGKKTIRGIPTYELRIDLTMKDLATNGSPKWSRLIYVDKERFLPVRMVELFSAGTATTDFFEMERLPRTPQNERLLQMSPHPGAKHQVEGPV